MLTKILNKGLVFFAIKDTLLLTEIRFFIQKKKLSKLHHLVFFSAFSFAFCGVHSDLLVIFLESCKVFPSFGEFTFFHTFTDVPVNECSLGIHQVEFVIKTSPGFRDSCSVG
ncbi:hypothetical protein WN55_06539 [Dufourea novaeangliae]|uniref:Uncharacterized protein n=1 Tax=Dufourea novaeangliae TaxID=178035 RepID=A0A154PQ45_DUFNO|nr:hypothetical protein WN55_06539 [Dufourea novaeangliae]